MPDAKPTPIIDWETICKRYTSAPALAVDNEILKTENVELRNTCNYRDGMIGELENLRTTLGAEIKQQAEKIAELRFGKNVILQQKKANRLLTDKLSRMQEAKDLIATKSEQGIAAENVRLRGLISETISHIDGWHDLTTRKKYLAVADKGTDLLLRLRAALKPETAEPKDVDACPECETRLSHFEGVAICPECKWQD